MAKRLIVLLLAATAGTGAYTYFNRPPTSLVLTGIVTTHDVVVSSQIGGRLERLAVQEGDTVTRDQVLAVIAPDELRAESSYALANAQGLSSQVQEAAAALRDGVRKVVASKVVTYDLARQMPGATEVRTSAFAQAVVDAIRGARR